jgi:hypothetical protein
MSLAPALAHLERSLPRAHLLKYTRAAVMRRPELRARSAVVGGGNEPTVSICRSRLSGHYLASAQSPLVQI